MLVCAGMRSAKRDTSVSWTERNLITFGRPYSATSLGPERYLDRSNIPPRSGDNVLKVIDIRSGLGLTQRRTVGRIGLLARHGAKN